MAVDEAPHGTPRRPGLIAAGALVLLFGVAMTVTMVIGIVRGQDLFLLLVVWMITGILPLWGGWNLLQKGLGHRSRGPDASPPPPTHADT